MSEFDITPLVPGGRQLILAYGDGGFRIGGQVHRGSVMVFAEHTDAWPVDAHEAISADSLVIPDDDVPNVDILLVGCGEQFVQAPVDLRAVLKDRGIVLEWMDTGAACRTFNVLLSEDRRAAAALLAIGKPRDLTK